jgi:hypothetical protein
MLLLGLVFLGWWPILFSLEWWGLNRYRVYGSPTVELVLGRSSNETFRVEIADEPVAKLWRLEELCSRLERHGIRIYDLLLGLPLSQA